MTPINQWKNLFYLLNCILTLLIFNDNILSQFLNIDTYQRTKKIVVLLQFCFICFYHTERDCYCVKPNYDDFKEITSEKYFCEFSKDSVATRQSIHKSKPDVVKQSNILLIPRTKSTSLLALLLNLIIVLNSTVH